LTDKDHFIDISVSTSWYNEDKSNASVHITTPNFAERF